MLVMMVMTMMVAKMEMMMMMMMMMITMMTRKPVLPYLIFIQHLLSCRARSVGKSVERRLEGHAIPCLLVPQPFGYPRVAGLLKTLNPKTQVAM